MITIRPFAYTDAEYEAIAAIEGAMFGDHSVSIEEWKHDDQNRDPDYPFQRDLIFKHDMLVAFVEYRQIRWAYHPQKYDCRIFVHPDHDAPDIRPTYLEHLLDILADKDLIAITSGMLEDKPEAMKFFADHGFEEVAREQISTLDVTAVDPQQFAPLITRVTDSGIVIRSVSQLMADEADWQRKLFDLDITISRDIPSLGEKHPVYF